MSIQTLKINKSSCHFNLPLYSNRVPAGFPSPADDHLDGSLDLNELLITHPAATFFCRVSGESMVDLGILDGDIIVVDRALEAQHGDIVLAAVNGELTCKLLDTNHKRLLSANEAFPPIELGDEADLIIEGVITASVHQHKLLR